MADDIVEPTKVDIVYETDEPVLYSVNGSIATISMNRTQYNNSQNAQLLYAMDDAFRQAVDDDEVRCIVLKGEGKHFTAGHDIGTPGRDLHKSNDSRKSLWWDHTNKPGPELAYVREQELYLGLCKRWRNIPKPTIASVHGACIAGGLMVAWICDLIIASDDAFFSDPVVRMGLPGVEYFAHPYEMSPRLAKEFLFLGERWSAEKALSSGMINKVVPRADLEAETLAWAEKVAELPRMGAALTKQAINYTEDVAGKHTAMDGIFHMHHYGHAYNDLTKGDYLAGFDGKAMAKSTRDDKVKK